MSQDNFNFEEEPAKCPLAQLPPAFWESLQKKPSFIRRHPILMGILAGLLVLFVARGCAPSEAEDVGECIALVKIQGAIIEPSATLAWIRKIENEPNVKGILLRIDSPGGGAAASQEIYAALARAGRKVPIAASMGATAASGGFMVAMAAQKIYANPSTITGSIGVRMDIPQLQELMAKIGVGQETLVTGPYKNAPSYTRPLSEADRQYLQGVIMNMLQQFVEIVAQSRHMSTERAFALADGKIYTGQQAKELGLIDELGGQEECLEWLCAQTGISPQQKLWQDAGDDSTLDRLIKYIGRSMASGIAEFSLERLAPAFLSSL